MKPFPFWAFCALIPFLFNSCSTSPSQKSVSLSDSTWDIEGGGTLSFSKDSYSMSFGCNTLSGTYSVSGSSITFQPGITTLIGCPEDIAKKENEYSNKILQMKSFTNDGDKLVLSGDKGKKITLNPPTHQKVTGTWKLQSVLVDMGDGMKGVTSSIEFEKSFIEIQEDGSYAGKAVCNNFHGKASLSTSSQSLHFGNIGMTKMYCGDADKQRMESLFIKAMEQVSSYSIDRNKLDLKDKDGTIQLTFVK